MDLVAILDRCHKFKTLIGIRVKSDEDERRVVRSKPSGCDERNNEADLSLNGFFGTIDRETRVMQ